MNVLSDVESLARSSVRDAALVRPDWTKGRLRDPKLLWLDKNENLDPVLAAIAKCVLAEVSSTELQTYPECGPLYRKLATKEGLPVESLLLAHGSDGVIRSVFEAFVEPGDIVMHTVPSFAMYAVYSRMYGARVIPLEYQPSPSGPHLTVEQVVSAIRSVRPKLVCLPNPDSPTGTVFGLDELRMIVEAAGVARALILVDEAYHPFYDRTCVAWTQEFQHLVVARTFAKAWGVAGLRIGYSVASPIVARLLHKVRPMYEVNTLAVATLERLLDHEADMRRSVARLNAGKQHFLSKMSECGLRTLNGHGNFLHVRFGPAAPAVHEALSSLVLYRIDFAEPCLKGFSRFSATTSELFQPIIDTIRRVVLKPTQKKL